MKSLAQTHRLARRLAKSAAEKDRIKAEKSLAQTLRLAWRLTELTSGREMPGCEFGRDHPTAAAPWLTPRNMDWLIDDWLAPSKVDRLIDGWLAPSDVE